MRGPFVVVVTLIAVAAAGCMLITGGTDGYSAAQAGAATCTSAAHCDAGGVCCLSVSSSTTSVVGACQSTCTTALPQLCATSAECGDAGPCAMLSCMVDGSPVSVSIQACGSIPGCKAQ